jgi:NAD(P)H dehydrogenase (quinone)
MACQVLSKAPYNTNDEPTNLIILVCTIRAMAPRRKLAELIAQGIESVPGMEARLRTVPAVSTVAEATEPDIPRSGAPVCRTGGPGRMRGTGAGLAHPLRQHGGGDEVLPRRHRGQWLSGTLSGKPAVVFTSTGSLHGGQESTLLSMMIPLLHHGMMVMGLPYTHPELMTTASGGSPYGATHWSGVDGTSPVTDDEKRLAIALGRRLAEAAASCKGWTEQMQTQKSFTVAPSPAWSWLIAGWWPGKSGRAAASGRLAAGPEGPAAAAAAARRDQARPVHAAMVVDGDPDLLHRRRGARLERHGRTLAHDGAGRSGCWCACISPAPCSTCARTRRRPRSWPRNCSTRSKCRMTEDFLGRCREHRRRAWC